jgi:hypothetical protein
MSLSLISFSELVLGILFSSSIFSTALFIALANACGFSGS